MASDTRSIAFTSVLIILTALGISSPKGFAQEGTTGQVNIDIPDTLTGSLERSQVAWACTQIANAAVHAHGLGKLSSVANEAAKVKFHGSSDDAFFNDFIKEFRLNPHGDLLFPGLLFSQTNIMWLEQKAPYRKEFEPVYTAYLAAECSRVAKFTPDR